MFPSTQRTFIINEQPYTMKQVTLYLQSQLEDDNIEVNYGEMIKACTDIPDAFMQMIPEEELEVICADIIEFSTDKSDGKGKPKKAIELIAWLLNKGHATPQEYRVDFVRVIINEYIEENKEK